MDRHPRPAIDPLVLAGKPVIKGTLDAAAQSPYLLGARESRSGV